MQRVLHKSTKQHQAEKGEGMKIKFLHTSDFQLGMTRWFLEGEAQGRFEADRLAAVRRLGEVAKEHGCAFIVVAGDVFETNSLSRRTTGRAFEAFAALPVPVYLMSGNHDPLTAASHLLEAKEIDGVHIIEDSTPIEVTPGVELVGAPLFSKQPTEDLVASALAGLDPDPNIIRIAVGHGALRQHSNETELGRINLEDVEKQIEAGVIDYLAMGDTHSTESLGSTGKVWYSGAPETTDFHKFGEAGSGESDSGNVLVVEVEKPGAAGAASTVHVEKVAVGQWCFESLKVDVNSQEDAELFVERLKAYENKPNTVVKYSLVGAVPLTTAAYLEQQIEALRPVFASLRERQRHMDLVITPSEDELDSLDIRGFVALALKDLQELDTPEARDAINLLFRLSNDGGNRKAVAR